MRAEQVFIVSVGAIEKPCFSGLPGSSPGRVSGALLGLLMHVGTEP